ncbi:MAG: hypothetical protein BGO78_13605 [Chloroflexi bacterium 44-23]|nr:MAG: hypothetical protein BGO78_13605 [Chloroflexi bacterium 44-23]
MKRNRLILTTLILFLTACQTNNQLIQSNSPTTIPSLESTEKVIISPTFVEPTETSFANVPKVMTPLPELTVTVTNPAVGKNSTSIVVDHFSVENFGEIPDEVLAQASDLKLLFRHASVGENIRYGLECMYGNFANRRPASCSPFHDLKYDSSNWVFQYRGNNGWIEKVNDFVSQTQSQNENFDVFMFTLGYLDGFDGMTYPVISDEENFQTRYIEPLEKLETQYPQKIFVWWTMSLAQDGYENLTKFNQMLRDYAGQNDKILMDLADIESHDLDGKPCVDSSGIPVICGIYTDEKQSGHLNETGRERVAKAFWYMMARITGWQDS